MEQLTPEQTETTLPRITFGIIVLNGMPFIPYNFRALYPFAHQIIVVEGAAAPAANINATPEGHSTDGTLEELYRFKAEEDPADKLIVVTAEDEGHPNGFWPGAKDEMSQAYACRATGDWLWQIDSDEFYLAEAMHKMVQVLASDSTISAVSFEQITFFGSPEYWLDGPFLQGNAKAFHRLFRWGDGYTYTEHEPPTVLDENGVDTRTKNWFIHKQTANLGIFMYHYALLFPSQVKNKCLFYAQDIRHTKTITENMRWYNEDYMQLRDPYHLHNMYNYPAWVNRFSGKIPVQITQMMQDIQAGKYDIELRRTADIEKLLSRPSYFIGKHRLQIPRYWTNMRIQLGRIKRAIGINHKFFK